MAPRTALPGPRPGRRAHLDSASMLTGPRDDTGLVRDDTRDAYRKVIQRLVDRGAEGVILGCTEIELLVGAGDSDVPLFPTTRLHVEAAVELALTSQHGA